jgi:predicted DNA repair protein MutK
MLWVGGHIMLQGTYDLGWHPPYDVVHTLEHPFAEIAVVGGFLAWLVNTLCSAVVGIIWGLVVMAIVHPLLKALPFGKDKGGHEEGDVRAELAGYRPEKDDGGHAK